ncbi:hypothetical protein [Enterococcus faecalis]
MKINKLVVKGPLYQRTITFSDGLNIIRGEKTSGKSLVLSLIDYCLGKSQIPLRVQVELNNHTDIVFLEVCFGKEIYTISRSLKKDSSNFYVYYSQFLEISEFMPEKMDKKELQHFLMNKLGIIEYKRKKSKKKSQELIMETISFRDIFRYCYIHQHDLGTDNFLSNRDYNVKYKNPIAFEMIFGLVDNSQNDIQSQFVDIQNKINRLSKRRDGLVEYLEQRGNEKFISLIDKIENLEKEIANYNKRKTDLINQQSEAKKDIGDNADFVIVKNELRVIDEQIDQLRRKIKRNNRGIESNNLLLKDYLREKNDVKVTEEINYRLKIVEHKLTCPLCHSEIDNTETEESSTSNTEKIYKALLNDIDTKIGMLTKVIQTSERNNEENMQDLNYLTRKKEILRMAANEFAKDIDTPFLPELNSINVTINGLEKDREILLESRRVHKKIDEIDSEIDDNRVRLDSLKSKLAQIENNQSRKEEILSSLNKAYIKNLNDMKYDDLSGAYIDYKSYIPYFKDASVYEHQSGGLLECMQISYLDAIISSNEALKHPRFLMLDSISKYVGTLRASGEEISEEDVIKDPDVYQNIFQILVRLSSSTQIIVVENTPPAEMDQYVKYTFRNGPRGFIDLEKNEIDLTNSESD